MLTCSTESIDNRATGCRDAEGGTRVSYYMPLSEANITGDANGQLIALALNTPGAMGRLRYDLDGTSNFVQNGNESGKKINIEQSAFMKFAGTSAAKAIIANAAKVCCELLLIHFQNDGSVFAQGVYYNFSSSEFVVGTKPARIVPNIDSGTSEGNSRLEYNITSTVKCFVPCDPTTITEAALDALL